MSDPIPDRHWRHAHGDVVDAWFAGEGRFGHRARIRTGRTTARILWHGPFRETKSAAEMDLDTHPRAGGFTRADD